MSTRTTPAGLAFALVALVGSNAWAQNPNTNNNANANNDRDAGKRETVRGVIAGVTVEGETAIDYTTRRAQVVEATFLTVVGAPEDRSMGGQNDNRPEANANRDNNDRNRDENARERNNQNIVRNSEANSARRTEGNSRHNVYVLLLSPKTEVRDATRPQGRDSNANANANRDRDERKGENASNNTNLSNNANTQGVPSSWEKLEVGDQVRITFTRREMSTSGGNAQQDQKAQRHGRHRTYFGEATSVTILSAPNWENERSNSSDRDRDDDKDKVKAGGNDKNENK